MDGLMRGLQASSSSPVKKHMCLTVLRLYFCTAGASASEVWFNKAAGRQQYSGTFMEMAKAVSDAAQGGMVLLSEGTFKMVRI